MFAVLSNCWACRKFPFEMTCFFVSSMTKLYDLFFIVFGKRKENEFTLQCKINYSFHLIMVNWEMRVKMGPHSLSSIFRLGHFNIHMVPHKKFSTFSITQRVCAFVNSMADACVCIQYDFFVLYLGLQITITKWIYNEELIYWIDKWLSQCHLTWIKCANNHYSSFEWRKKRVE